MATVSLRSFPPNGSAPRQESTPHPPRNFSFSVLKLTDCNNQRGLNQAPSPNCPTSGAELYCRTRKNPQNQIRFPMKLYGRSIIKLNGRKVRQVVPSIHHALLRHRRCAAEGTARTLRSRAPQHVRRRGVAFGAGGRDPAELRSRLSASALGFGWLALLRLGFRLAS